MNQRSSPVGRQLPTIALSDVSLDRGMAALPSTSDLDSLIGFNQIAELPPHRNPPLGVTDRRSGGFPMTQQAAPPPNGPGTSPSGQKPPTGTVGRAMYGVPNHSSGMGAIHQQGLPLVRGGQTIVVGLDHRTTIGKRDDAPPPPRGPVHVDEPPPGSPAVTLRPDDSVTSVGNGPRHAPRSTVTTTTRVVITDRGLADAGPHGRVSSGTNSVSMAGTHTIMDGDLRGSQYTAIGGGSHIIRISPDAHLTFVDDDGRYITLSNVKCNDPGSKRTYHKYVDQLKGNGIKLSNGVRIKKPS